MESAGAAGSGGAGPTHYLRPFPRPCLRGEALLGPRSLHGSSRWTDLGRGFLGLALGLPRPCSSRICCCFRRRYSCLISSRRAFSSSLRIRSSSALRLREGPAGASCSRPESGGGGHDRPGGQARLELDLCLQLLPPHAGLLSLALLLQEEGRPLLGELVIRLLLVLQSRRHL